MRLYNALTILSCAALITACGGSSSNDGSTPEASPAPTNSPVAAPSPTQSPQPTASQTPLPTGTPVSSPTQAPTQNEPPVSTFSFSAQQLTVIFDGSASRDPEGNRITFVWDFGDNTTQDGSRTLAIPSHTYANDGSYVVSLTVSDGALTTTSTQTVTVKRGVIVSPPSTPGPVASSPTPRPNQPTTAPTTVPTPIPSSVPTATPAPTSKPTPTPNPTPTTRPTATPTSEPTARPTATPAPTNPPTPTPTAQPNPTPAPGDDCSTREYCDDFEQAPIGAGSHGPWKSSGTVMVSDERAFSGDQSVKIVSKGGGYNRNFLSLDLANRNKLQQNQFGRMMIWIDDPGNNGGDFTFVQAEGKPKANTGAPANTNVMYRYRVDGGATNGTLMANYDTWIDADNNGQTDWLTDCWDKSTVQLPRKEWSCVEWQFDAKQNELRYWLNGKAIDELTVQGSGEGCVGPQTQMSTWYGPQRFEILHLGIEQYHGGVPVRTAYIDDVALDNRYVGCPSNPGTGGSGNGGSTGGGSTGGGNTGGGNTGGGNTGGGQNTGNTGAGTLFSMDFENENVNAVPNGWNSFVSYQANNNNNRPQANNFALVGDSRARSGSKALHVKSNGQPAQIVKRLPDNIDTLHVRAWVYSSRVLGSDSNDNHEHILGVKAYEGGDSSSSFSANKEVRVGQGKGHLGFNVVPNSDAISPTMDKWYKGPTTPANEWYCVETEMQVNSKTGGYDSLIMKLNGNEVNAVRSKDDWHVNSVGSNWLSDKLGYVMFGWHSFSNHAAELWIDDIVVSTQPIGCN